MELKIFLLSKLFPNGMKYDDFFYGKCISFILGKCNKCLKQYCYLSDDITCLVQVKVE